MGFLVKQTSEKVEMMGWMSAGRAANMGLLREREDAQEDVAVAASDTGCCWVHSHVELPQEVDAQDGFPHPL